MSDKFVLTREALLNGDVARLVHEQHKDMPRMSDVQRAELVERTVSELDGSDLWVFGYGSLIWNPAMEFDEQRCCNIEGYKKKFCFWTTLSRGTIEQPGLMMGLVEGGQCNGVAFRIKSESVATELDVLFRREMSHYVYKSTWVDAACVDTHQQFKALTFVVDVENDRFVDNLTYVEVVRTLATAVGPLGRNCDYLFQLFEKLHELGFEDAELEGLVRSVRQYQSENDGANL